MKRTLRKKLLAAGGALLMLLSLVGCTNDAAANTAADDPALTIMEDTIPTVGDTVPEMQSISPSTEKTEENKAVSSTKQTTNVETEETISTEPSDPTGVPEALEEQPVQKEEHTAQQEEIPEKPAEPVPAPETPTPEAPAPEAVPVPQQPAPEVSAPEEEPEPLPDQNPYVPDIDVPDERPTFEGMDFIFMDEWAKEQYESARYPDMQTTKPDTGDTTLDHWLSLVLEHHELTLEVGEKYQMAYSFFGSDTLQWRSEDESVLTVDQTGLITAHAEGQTRLVVVSGECGARQCAITVIQKHPPIMTKDEQARAIAKDIADLIMNDPTITTDIERIAYAARFVNAYVDMGHTSSFHEDCRTAYGTFVAGYSNCVGSTKATGLVLEYMGFSWSHVNQGQWGHQWCEVYDVDGQTAFCDGSIYGIVGFGSRLDDGSNWLYLTSEGQLVSFNEYFC